tara:strand:- start:2472 stop:2888 length:417 start_codon:yes stop_codon:yes gene_type:complete
VIKKKDLSQKDKKTWEDFIKNPSDIYDKEKNNQKRDRKERFKFDLHGFSLDDANQKVKEILLFCVENKYKELLLITGKGKHSTSDKDAYISKDFGKLKYSVPEFIRFNSDLKKLVISIEEAEVKDGGEGAILIRLKNL